MPRLFRANPAEELIDMDDSIAEVMESSMSSMPFRIVVNFFRYCFFKVLDWLMTVWSFIVYHHFALASALFVIMDVLTTIFSKRLIDHTHNYVTVTVQGITGIHVVLFAIIFVFFYIVNRGYVQRPFSLKPLMVLGVLDVFTTTLSAVGSTHTSGLMLVLLGQVAVPLTIVSCTILLSKKYHRLHYVSSFIIIFFVVIKPLMRKNDSYDDILIYNLMYALSLIPDSIAAALREMQYTSQSFHLLKYQFFTSLIAMVLNFLAMLPLVPKYPDMNKVQASAKYMTDGFKCLFLGVNTIVDNCGTVGVSCDTCEGSPGVLLSYIFFSLIIRVMYIIIMFKGSATFIFLLGAAKVPLTSIAFSLRFIAGNSTTTLSFIDVVCFIGTVVGLCMYALGTKRLQESQNDVLTQPLLQN